MLDTLHLDVHPHDRRAAISAAALTADKAWAQVKASGLQISLIR